MPDSTNPYESPQSETEAPTADTPAKSRWRCHGARLIAWLLLALALGRVVYVSWDVSPDSIFDSYRLLRLLGVIGLLVATLYGAWFNLPWYLFGAIYGLLVAFTFWRDIGDAVASMVGGSIGCVVMGAAVEAVCAWILRAADKPLDTPSSKSENNDLVG